MNRLKIIQAVFYFLDFAIYLFRSIFVKRKLNMCMEKYKIEDCIAFNSYNENFVLSNMYPCKLEYKGNIFYGVDHLYFYLLYYKHWDVQKELLECSGVCANFNAKKIGEANKHLINDIKKEKRYKLLFKIINLKFEQCQLFREELLKTNGKILVEFAFWGDTEYGCYNKNDWYIGENITGKLLMQIRDNNIIQSD